MKARFLLPARRELKEAVRYYNSQRAGLGDEFRDEAWETVRRIKEFPQKRGIRSVARSGDVKCDVFPSALFTSPPSLRL